MLNGSKEKTFNEMEQDVLPTAGLIIIKDNRLLLAYSKNKKAWYLPGGKIDPGESAVDTILRESFEELSLSLDTRLLSYYCHISATAYGETPGLMMEQECFIYEGNDEIRPGNEIEAVRYYDHTMYLSEPAQVPGVLKVFEQLHKDHKISNLSAANEDSPHF